MKTGKLNHSAATILIITLSLLTSGLKAQNTIVPGWKINPEKELNPNTQWLREAKWGLFTHYLVHMPSAPVPEDMTAEKWNKKVNSFQVKKFADQLVELKVPYFFITIGQGGGYYCSPNKTYERLFGSSNGKFSSRDLVLELAKELTNFKKRFKSMVDELKSLIIDAYLSGISADEFRRLVDKELAQVEKNGI